jgi:hypothetical protein
VSVCRAENLSKQVSGPNPVFFRLNKAQIGRGWHRNQQIPGFLRRENALEHLIKEESRFRQDATTALEQL